MLNNLGRNNGDPWLLGGDFNEILQETEKRGRSVCDFKILSNFRDCLDINGLRELDSRGYKYTWSNKRRDGLIEEKLDHFISNSDWWASFPNASVENLFWDGSDHLPMVLYPTGDFDDGRDKDQKDLSLFVLKQDGSNTMSSSPMSEIFREI